MSKRLYQQLHPLVSFTLILGLILFNASIGDSATPPTQPAVKVTWDANNPTPDGYRVYKRAEGQAYNYSQPAWTGSEIVGHVNGLDWDTTYYFVVRAYAGTQESADSNEVKYTTPRLDSDGDGVADTEDAFPSDPKEWLDSDGDGVGDNADPDSPKVVDNDQPGTSSSGEWSLSGGVNPYGTQSVYSNKTGATYTFTSPISGVHDVEMWWTEYSNRCTAVPVEIYDGTTLLETVTINQLQNGGQWNFIGTYTFSGQAKVVIVSAGGCTTSADAVVFNESVLDSDGDGVLDADDAFPFDGNESNDNDGDGTGDNADTDDDNDGMSDAWEIAYGLDPLVDDCLQDLDADGISNLDEYKNGSDPSKIDIVDNDSDRIIVDDGQPGASSSGEWIVSGGVNPHGAQSLYSNKSGATYSFVSPVSGTYDVELWWTEYANRCTAVPVEIYDGTSLLETVVANQQQNGGQWNFMGTYAFSGQAKVVIVSKGGCTTSADAVRFSAN